MSNSRPRASYAAFGVFAVVVLLVAVWGLPRSPSEEVASPSAVQSAPGSDWDPSERLARAWRALRGKAGPHGREARDARLGRPGSESLDALGAVEGMLVSAPGDRPCRRAFVLLARVGRAPLEEVSDEAGAFHFGRVPVGRWFLRARDEGGRVVSRQLLVQEDRTTHLGRLRIASRAFVEVEVRQESGDLVPGAVVRVLRPVDSFQDQLDRAADLLQSVSGVQDPALVVEGMTDAKGRVRLDGMDPGPATVEAYASGFVSAWTSTVVAESGASGGLLTLRLREGRSLEGVVVDERGRGVPHAWVMIRDADDVARTLETIWGRPTDAEGRFQATLSKGITRVEALVGARGRPAQYFRVDVGEGPLRFELGAEARLVVDVRRRGKNEPASGVVVTAHGGPAARPLGASSKRSWTAKAESDGRGRAVVPVRPGYLHLLSVEYAPGGVDTWVLWSDRRSGDRPCTFAGLEGGRLEAGENVVSVEVPPALDPARIFGRVVDEDERPLAGVRIFVEDEVGIDPRTGAPAVSDAEGRYDVLAPREAYVYVFAVRPGWVMRYGAIVEVGEDDDEVEEDIQMQPASAVTGRVVDERGVGVANVRVRIAAKYFEPRAERPGLAGPTFALTGPAGGYVLDGLRSAVGARVVARGTGYVASASKPFRLRAGTTVRAPHVVLRAAHALRVRVLDPAGRPVARARIAAQSLDEDEDLPRGDVVAQTLQAALPGLFAGDWTRGLTDASGVATLEGLALGRVALGAGHRGFAAARREVVHARPGGAAVAHDIRLVPAFDVDGTVLDGKGAPVPYASVRLRRPRGTEEERSAKGVAFRGAQTTSDASGRFAFEDVPHVSLDIRVEAEGYRGLRKPGPTGPDTLRLVLVRADPEVVRRLAEIGEELYRVSCEHMEAIEDETDEDGSREEALALRIEELEAEQKRIREALGLDG